MKKIFALMLLLVSIAGYSQIELVATESTEIISKVSHVYIEKKGENEYSFYYKNINSVEHEYAHFSFKDLDNDFEKLYQILNNGFIEVPRDPLKLKAKGEVVWLNYKVNDNDGEVTLQVEQFISRDPDVKTTSRPMTQQDIQRLFKKA
ncbi:hypothetical protein [Tenacibaculum sp. IB213877]|uniref:hypothetical protein n=1 Tax=Tenacibaculum sp. IB213877 TaxID=3097351 RepID=UPI002A5A7F52|nr:hypothetical protein [Tenacibaculum sp. IB213877]MDY0779680.1 hypothetical protein [Tenacibaculum sp. IB213877]